MAGNGNGGFNRLDTKFFDEAIGEMEMANKAFQEAKEAIVNGVTNQLLDCWEGKGAKKFESSFKRLKRELIDREETLCDMCEDLKIAYRNYAEVDNRNAADVRAALNGGGSKV